MNSKQTRWLLFKNNDQVLLNKKETLPTTEECLSLAPHFIRRFSLSCSHETAFFCAELDAATPLNDRFKTLPLKQALSMLYPDQYTMGVKAYSMIQWDKNHQFCGRCGGATNTKEQTLERVCGKCDISFFPRISPSIIVLIYKDDQLLMARSPHFPAGVYALIAGFVEIGETLEETVHREVQEEVGLKVKNIAYFGSQPWPFPDSLMIGFTAEYESGEIITNDGEIEHAGWYRYDNLPGRPSMHISIASILLDNFIRQCAKNHK